MGYQRVQVGGGEPLYHQRLGDLVYPDPRPAKKESAKRRTVVTWGKIDIINKQLDGNGCSIVTVDRITKTKENETYFCVV